MAVAKTRDNPHPIHGDTGRYTIVTQNDKKGRCIASTQPTKKEDSRRCRSSISPDEVKQSDQLYSIVVSSHDPFEAFGTLRKLILLRCCSRHHRDKLGAEGVCLDALTLQCIRLFNDQALLQISVPRSLPANWTSVVDNERFIPYRIDPCERILDVLRSDVPLRKNNRPYPSRGSVYAFAVPDNLTIQKIGYTAKSVETRRQQWNDCFPGRQVTVWKSFPFPERIENLIHLELRDVRKQRPKCTCFKSHNEFFEISAEGVTAIINEWYTLVDKHALYDDGDRKLTVAWRKRLSNLSEGASITASLLLGMLEQEEKQLQDATSKAVKIKSKSIDERDRKSKLSKQDEAIKASGPKTETIVKNEAKESIKEAAIHPGVQQERGIKSENVEDTHTLSPKRNALSAQGEGDGGACELKHESVQNNTQNEFCEKTSAKPLAVSTVDNDIAKLKADVKLLREALVPLSSNIKRLDAGRQAVREVKIPVRAQRLDSVPVAEANECPVLA